MHCARALNCIVLRFSLSTRYICVSWPAIRKGRQQPIYSTWDRCCWELPGHALTLVARLSCCITPGRTPIPLTHRSNLKIWLLPAFRSLRGNGYLSAGGSHTSQAAENIAYGSRLEGVLGMA